MDVPDTVAVDDQAAELLYRVAQEAVRNVARHSAASTVETRLQVTGAGVTLAVVDDGIGFDVADLPAVPAGGRLGLLLVSDLIRAAGGTLEIVSQPLRGTRVQVGIATVER
jgi:signal transduction histidine kinase